MTIKLNGEGRELQQPIAIQGLLADLGVDPRLVAVEVNRVVVKRALYAETLIHDGDDVEIVAFVGGG